MSHKNLLVGFVISYSVFLKHNTDINTHINEYTLTSMNTYMHAMLILGRLRETHSCSNFIIFGRFASHFLMPSFFVLLLPSDFSGLLGFAALGRKAFYVCVASLEGASVRQGSG